jgi:c-di-GMP-binding flagellar brake protein YcgR
MIFEAAKKSSEGIGVLHVELGARLLITLDGFERNLWSTLIGIELGKYLIIRTPQIDGIESFLKKRSSVRITYFFSGTVYGFQSEILEHISIPSQLIFISFPTDIRKIELREHPRIDCCTPGKFIVNSQKNSGMILDLSAAGCRFSMMLSELDRFPQLEVADPIELELVIPGSDTTRILSGRVKNIIKDSKKMNVGVHFNSLDNMIMRELETYIKESIEFGGLLHK